MQPANHVRESLLPPLWQIVREYGSPAERLYWTHNEIFGSAASLKELLIAAAAENHIPAIKYVLRQNRKLLHDPDPWLPAVRGGHAETLRLFRAQFDADNDGGEIIDDLLAEAIEFKKDEIVDVILTIFGHQKHDIDLRFVAIRKGYMRTLSVGYEWLNEKKRHESPDVRELVRIAINGENIAALQFMRNNDTDYRIYIGYEEFHLACRAGKMPVIDFFMKNGFNLIPESLAALAADKTLGTPSWRQAALINIQCQRRPATVFLQAVNHCNIELLEWLAENKHPMDSRVMAAAVLTHDPRVVKWLWDRKCPADWTAYKNAVNSRQPDMIRLLHSFGIEIGWQPIHAAIENNRLEELKLLIESADLQETESKEEFTLIAVEKGCVCVVKYFQQIGFPFSQKATAILHGDYGVWPASYLELS